MNDDFYIKMLSKCDNCRIWMRASCQYYIFFLHFCNERIVKM